MANIYFKCSCGKSLAVDEQGAGRSVACPDCSNSLSIPYPILHWSCPKCSEAMASSSKMAGVFIQCCTCKTPIQVPTALGSRITVSAPQPKNKTLLMSMLTLVALLIGGGAVFFFVPPKVLVSSINAIVAMVSNPQTPPPIVPTNQVVPTTPIVLTNQVVSTTPPPIVLTNQVVPINQTNLAPVKPVFDQQLFAKSVEEGTPIAERELSQNHALLVTNETISIRLPAGLLVNGIVQSIGKDNVAVITAVATDTVAFADMDFNNRLRCDPELRSLWVALNAAIHARKDMDDKDIVIPKYNASDSLDDLNAAASLGDPEAEYKFGQFHLKGGTLKKDPGFAFLYFQMAAKQEHWLSAYWMGRMYLAGLSVEPDKAEGEKFIAMAADKGCDAAKKFIEKQRQEKDEQKILALQQQEKQRAEEAQREAEARAQQAAEDQQRRAKALGKPSGLSLPKSMGGARL